MRRDNLEFAQPPGDDRPGDTWMPAVDGSGSGADARTRTWMGNRRRWTGVFMVVVSLGALSTLALVPQSDLIKPGALSTPHAQILAGTMASEKCGACHHQAALSPLAWFRSASNSHAGVRQSDLCLDCHHGTINANLAYAAHNLPLSVRDQMTETIRLASKRSPAGARQFLHRFIPEAAVDQNNVACGTCHKEHHGADGDLLSLSNTQCQTCHSKRFGAFPETHPDWNGWPYGRGKEIAFNHASHQQSHFPAWKSGIKRFDCGTCHPDAGNGELVRVTSYERSCKVCHDESMNVQAGKGIDFIALPSLPKSVLANVNDWPEGATGFADGVISPLAELMLRADPSVTGAVRAIPAAGISRLPIDDDRTEEHLKRLAQGYQTLIHDIGRNGQSVIRERLLEQGISPGPFQPILRSLPPQLIESAEQIWFPRSSAFGGQNTTLTRSRPVIRMVLAEDEDLLGSELLSERDDDDLLMDDLLLEDPRLVPGSESPALASRAPASSLVPGGGWYRDDQRFSVSYRGNGHADPVMVGMIETFAQLGDHDPLKQRFFDAPFVIACVSCHRAATSIPATWKASGRVGQRSEFTKFSHRPHLSVSTLGDCGECHQIRDQTTVTNHEFVFAGSEFKPLQRHSCAACHHTKAAGEDCTTCHRYHISQ